MILMGTGPFAVPSFEAIRAAGHEIALVVTRPMPPIKSRGGPPPSPVRDWANEHDLPLWDPASINDDAAIEQLVETQSDLMVVCDYGQILKPDALAAARWGGINLHGSLLPAYRGAAPVQRALLSGDSETGVSVIHMTPRLDGGPIVTSATTAILPTETSGELEERLSAIGVDATMQAIEILQAKLADHSWGDALPLVGEPQDKSLISKAPRLSKAEAEIDWTKSAREIDCLVRGMQPWPVAFTFVKTNPDKPAIRVAIKRVRIESATELAEADSDQTADNSDIDNSDMIAGQLLHCEPKNKVAVATGDGVIVIERLQPAGKKEMDAAEFIRGHRLTPGTQFGVPK
ncbi:methionyl-tRNA formyltransferase [Neorhodopirellula lusitana]|uniref:Methionyl-tRNA formyltransferase n=1 Tax=Neorhodopirellula lusitana TaxID=445327 RepID=A0ABY1QNF6_9BACT|nr:methionyl-tRNA formyltransferase [Neorhodopirellula lusitana]SMP75577.1 methionyl-tRNA formyltransferase [Neorhodopirellula lusitana]